MKFGDNLNASRIALKLLTLLPAGDGGAVILVTSAVSGEGKSFVSRVLAGQISRSLGVNLTPVDASRRNDPVGPSADIGKLIADDRLFNVAGVKRGFDGLRATTKLALIDGPVLSECGAMLLHADAVVLVVDSRRTPPEAVKGALAAVQLDAGRIVGVLLNRASLQKY